MSHTRIESWDAIKCFAIYIMIVSHILLYFHFNKEDDKLLHVIISFNMPLFMVVSGYFAYSSLQKTLYSFITKKFIQLILPVITWTILSILFIFVTDKGSYHSEIVGSYWFLRTLFACYVATWCVKKCFRNDYLGFIISAIFFILIPKGSFLQFNWLYIFFWVGIFFRKYNVVIFEIKNSKRYILFLLCSAIVFIIAYYLKSTFYINSILISFTTIKISFLSIMLNFLVALSACLFIILLFSIKDKWPPIIKNIGMHTLGIYLVQGLLLERILPLCFQLEIQQPFLSFFVTLLFSAIILLICNYIVEYSSRIKIINLLFFGNQYNHSN